MHLLVFIAPPSHKIYHSTINFETNDRDSISISARRRVRYKKAIESLPAFFSVASLRSSLTNTLISPDSSLNVGRPSHARLNSFGHSGHSSSSSFISSSSSSPCGDTARPYSIGDFFAVRRPGFSINAWKFRRGLFVARSAAAPRRSF